MNKMLLLLFFVLAPSVGAYGQSIELIPRTEETLFYRLTDVQKEERFNQRIKFWDGLVSGAIKETPQERENRDLEILPGKLYTGEPIDAYYGMKAEGPATCELYDLRGKRPKRLIRKYIEPKPNDGPARLLLRVRIDEPGCYELVVFYESYQFEKEQHGMKFFKPRQILDVHERPKK